MSENADRVVGRYQIVAIGKDGAVLLDTATGSSWSLARDIDTLQLGWKPLEEQWPGAAVRQPSEPPQAFAAANVGKASSTWWRLRFGSERLPFGPLKHDAKSASQDTTLADSKAP